MKRFWDKVSKTKNGCWLWTASKDRYGYGRFYLNGIAQKSHRVVWELTYKISVPKNLFVCHHCDIRNCVNPEHLFLGTNRDNIVDSAKKGNQSKKLNIEKVRKICFDPRPYRKIAKDYKIHQSAVWYIKHRHIWTHIDPLEGGQKD